MIFYQSVVASTLVLLWHAGVVASGLVRKASSVVRLELDNMKSWSGEEEDEGQDQSHLA